MKTFVIKAVTALLLSALPMYVIGQNQSDSVVFFDEGSPDFPITTYYHAIPGRFFIQRSPDASLDYITSLLNELTDSPFESSWHSTKEIKNCYCRVIIDDALIDNLIQELLKNDSVLVARRIYIQTDFFNKYVAFLQKSDVDYTDYFKEPNLKNQETVFFNEILCSPVNYNPDIVPQDSICNSIGVTLTPQSRSFIAQPSKNADIFEVANKLLQTGYFISVRINYVEPFIGKVFDDIYGDKINRSDHFYLYDQGKIEFYQIQGRFFILKNDTVSQDVINKILNNTIHSDYETEWLYDDICRVITDEQLIDDIIKNLLQYDDVQTARRIYVSRNDYCSYLFYPDLEQGEMYFLNYLGGFYKGEFNQSLMDSLSNDLGLIIRSVENYFDNYLSVSFYVTKSADLFEACQKLFETGCFSSIYPTNMIPPIINHWGETSIHPIKEDLTVQEVLYYNMTGRRLETPSGLTIVVTRYSDGSIRREKILFL